MVAFTSPPAVLAPKEFPSMQNELLPSPGTTIGCGNETCTVWLIGTGTIVMTCRLVPLPVHDAPGALCAMISTFSCCLPRFPSVMLVNSTCSRGRHGLHRNGSPVGL